MDNDFPGSFLNPEVSFLGKVIGGEVMVLKVGKTPNHVVNRLRVIYYN